MMNSYIAHRYDKMQPQVQQHAGQDIISSSVSALWFKTKVQPKVHVLHFVTICAPHDLVLIDIFFMS